MPVPLWAGHYIGLPFQDHGRDRSGLDCWGLVRLVLGEQFGHALPSFQYDYPHTTATQPIRELILREAALWTAVDIPHAQCGDVIVLRLCGHPAHVGCVLGDGTMLHIESGINSAIEKYTGARWKDRVFGIYRYKTSGTP